MLTSVQFVHSPSLPPTTRWLTSYSTGPRPSSSLSLYRSSSSIIGSAQIGYPTITVTGLIRSGNGTRYNNSGIYVQPPDQTGIVTKVLASSYAVKKDTAVITSKFTSEWYSSGLTFVTHTDRTVRRWEPQFCDNCMSQPNASSTVVLTFFRFSSLLVITLEGDNLMGVSAQEVGQVSPKGLAWSRMTPSSFSTVLIMISALMLFCIFLLPIFL